MASLDGSNTTTASTNAGGSQDRRQAALNFAKCLREHGLNVPDPNPNGKIDLDRKPDPKLAAAQQACQKYNQPG